MSTSDITITVVESDGLAAAARSELRALWRRAFEDRFDEHDAAHAYGGVHVLAYADERLVGHASAVPRRIRFGDEPWRTIGYVEAVATDPAYQRRGIGGLVMRALHTEIAARWPVAMLSTGQATGFYAALGWESWQGLSYTATATDVVADDEHGGLMILRLDPAAVRDLTTSVTCEDRPGDAW